MPKSEVSVVCLCNIDGAPVELMSEEVAAIYANYAVAIREPAAPKAPHNWVWKPAEQTQLSGSFWSEELFSVWQFAQRDGKFWLQSDGTELAVTPNGDGYTAGGFDIKPARDPSGRVMGFEVSAGVTRGISFARR